MEWYYAENYKEKGPITDEAFRELVESGQIRADTLVWHAGLTEWQEYAGLAGADGLETVPSGAPASALCIDCQRAFPKEDMIHYEDFHVCASCRPFFFQKVKEGMRVGTIPDYAGFWIRLAAKIIDGIILGAVNMFTTVIGSVMIAMDMVISGAVIMYALQFSIPIAYNTWMVGRYGATIGKMACQIRIITSEGGRVGYGRAVGRHFAEFLSWMILMLGYVMAAFDEEKASLHDRICNTRVVRK